MKNVNILTDNGVNVQQGLELFGDMEMYDETLADFLTMVADKLNHLEQTKSTDMPNYAIEVHSLKSDARYLGFTTLADLAYQSEMKSKASDVNFVLENHPKVIAETKRIISLAQQYLGQEVVDLVPNIACDGAPAQNTPAQPGPVQAEPMQAMPVQNNIAQAAPVQPMAMQNNMAQAAPVQPMAMPNNMAQAVPVQPTAMPNNIAQAVPVQPTAMPNNMAQAVPVQPTAMPNNMAQAIPVQPMPAQNPTNVELNNIYAQSSDSQIQFMQPSEDVMNQYLYAQQQQVQNTNAIPQTKNGAILVIDDSNLVSNFVKKIFSATYDVYVANDGNTGIQMMTNPEIGPKVKACLLDLNMPNMNGFQVMDYFYENGIFVKTPVAVISGAEDTESLDKANTYPIIDILPKPFNERDVQRVVEKCLAAYF